MKTTTIALKSSQVSVSADELRGINPVFQGATFLEGDTVVIPEEPQLAKETLKNGKIRVFIGVYVNGKEKLVSLSAFISVPMTGSSEQCKEKFLRRHQVNSEIHQGDAADQVLYLAGKTLKVSKEINWAPVLEQNSATGKWQWARDEHGEPLHKEQTFSVFTLA